MIKITTFEWKPTKTKAGKGYNWEPADTFMIKGNPESLFCLFSGVLFTYRDFIDGSDAYRFCRKNYSDRDLTSTYLYRCYEREIAKLVKRFKEESESFYIHDWFNFTYQIKPGKYIQLIAEVV